MLADSVGFDMRQLLWVFRVVTFSSKRGNFEKKENFHKKNQSMKIKKIYIFFFLQKGDSEISFSSIFHV